MRISPSLKHQEQLMALKSGAEVKKTARKFIVNLTIQLVKQRIPQPPSIGQDRSFLKNLAKIQEQYHRNTTLKAIEGFTYSNIGEEVTINITWMLGLQGTFTAVGGQVTRSHFRSLHPQTNFLQLCILADCTWDLYTSVLQHEFMACFKKITSWIEKHREIFTKPCKICGFHLSFKSGQPLLPLLLTGQHLVHVDCQTESVYC